jgi:hypothetical protein
MRLSPAPINRKRKSNSKSITRRVRPVTEAYTHVQAVILLRNGYSDHRKGCEIVVLFTLDKKAIPFSVCQISFAGVFGDSGTSRYQDIGF